MFSSLGPLFKTQLRQAEAADTRLEIRRDEKQEQGKKREPENESDEASFLWDDSTSVSVEALRTFLIEFLKGRGEPVPEAPAPVGEPSLMAGLTPQPRPPASSRAAAAVKAYTAMSGQQQHFEPPSPPQEPETPEDVDLVSLLKADELRTIHVLIGELDILARKGVQTLVIEKADTFLESLVQAVRLEKSKA